MKYILTFFLFFTLNSYSLVSDPKIVIFCYHSFNQPDNILSVSSKSFEEQIDSARKKGYEIISENSLKDFYYNGINLKEKNLLVTIDDGYVSVLNIINDICVNKGIFPTMFIYPEIIGKGKHLEWIKIKEMADMGINFGSHSYSHFSNLDFLQVLDIEKLGKKLEKELVTSASLIENHTGRKIYSYAHPYGIFDSTIEKITNIRYKLVYTTAKGPNGINTNPHRLNRYIIRNDTGQKEIEDFLDYEMLPIVKTYPDNGGFTGNEELIIFYFRNGRELSKFHGFKFKIDGEKGEIGANIGRSIVWFDCKKIKRRVYDLSLTCYDDKNRKFIYSILINSKK